MNISRANLKHEIGLQFLPSKSQNPRKPTQSILNGIQPQTHIHMLLQKEIAVRGQVKAIKIAHTNLNRFEQGLSIRRLHGRRVRQAPRHFPAAANFPTAV